MSIISKPNTFSAGAVIIASQHNANFDTIYSDYNGNIDSTNISSLDGSKLTGLSNIPIGSGNIPIANIPNFSATKITSGTIDTARINTGTSAGQIVVLDGSAKLPAVDGSQLTGISAFPIYTIGSDISTFSNDAPKTTTNSSYILVKEMKSHFATTLTLRIQFKLENSTSSVNARGRIYINSSPVGTERSANNGGIQIFTEDISVPSLALIQIYAYSNGGSDTVTVSNFRILSTFDIQLSPLGFYNNLV